MSAFLQGSGLSAGEVAEPGDGLLGHVSVTKISPAVLNLQRVYEQNRQRLEQIDSGTMPDATAQQQPAKGAPRLLLMGQRRYVMSLVCRFTR
jgi:Ras-related GTP-binding protein C/D